MHLRLATWFSLLATTLAHSSQRPPIRTVHSLHDATLYSRDRPLTFKSNLELAFSTPTGPVQLELVPNLDLLHHGQSTFLLDNGDQSLESSSEAIDPTQYRVYKGHTLRSTGIETRQVGKARVLVHSVEPLLFEGTFKTETDTYHVQLAQSYRRLSHPEDVEYHGSEQDAMVLWADSDIAYKLVKRSDEYSPFEVEDNEGCSTDTLEYNRLQIDSSWATKQQSVNVASLVRRQLFGDTSSSFQSQAQLAATIGRTAGCPRQREVAVLGAVADCNFVQMFDSAAAARASIIGAFNSASSVYEDALNISLGLGQIVMSDSVCPSTPNSASAWNIPCDATTTMADRLSLFSTWRGLQPDSYAAWSLMTTCSTESEIGVAWLGTLCSTNSTNQTDSVVSGTNVVAATSSSGNYWRTLAHELGHNFGANHDCTAASCGTRTTCCPLSTSVCPAGGAYLMNPSASTATSDLSQCSIGQICTNFLTRRVTTSCLSNNQNVQLAEGAASCGNGIVEAGEDCDCGGPAGCGNNPCCNPNTCRFNEGAVCDSELSTCCTDQCQFAPAETICRASTGECDPSETCTGTSGQCPDDRYATNGQSCGSGLACASGQCTSRDLQCLEQMNSTQGSCGGDARCSLTCLLDGQCYRANTNLISGTPCGNGGRCQAGYCDEGSVGDQVESWFDRNRNWLIPVVSVVGGLIVLAVLWRLIASCIGGRKRKNNDPPQMTYTSQNYVPTQYAQSQNTWQPYNNGSYDPPRYPDQTYRGY